MKRELKTMPIFICLLLPALPICADIGENFQKSDLGFGGGARLLSDRTYFLQDDAASLRSIHLYPEGMIFVRDGLSLSFCPSFYYADRRLGGGNDLKEMEIGLSGSLLWYRVSRPERTTGFVPALGLTLGLILEPGIDDEAGYTPVEQDTPALSATAGPQLRLCYFVTDRFSPYFNFVPTFEHLFLYRENGSTVDLDLEDRLQLRIVTTVGFIYHFPGRGPAELKTD